MGQSIAQPGTGGDTETADGSSDGMRSSRRFGASGPLRVLLVEDDIADLKAIRRALSQEEGQFSVYETSCAETAMGIIDQFNPDCILLDNHLPNCTGLEFLERFIARFGKGIYPVIMITGDESQRTGIAAMKLGVSEFVSKADLEELNLAGLIHKVVQARVHQHEEGRRVYTEKLASLAQMVAGTAHEINNPAAIARLTLAAVKETLSGFHGGEVPPVNKEELGRLEDLVKAADDALARIGTVVRGLEGQTGTSLGHIHRFSLDQAVRAAEPTIASLVHDGKQLIYSLDSRAPFIGDLAQLSRTIIDVVANALEAVDRGGIVEVSTKVNGDFVEVVVDDDGPGIGPEFEEVVFEPLFTTRRHRGALGMGLARASAVIERHGGTIHVQRSRRGGARLVISIPQFRGDISPKSYSLVPRTRRAGNERLRVLVVDDDPGIRASYERVLETEFEVVAADGADKALDDIEQKRFDVILCDVIMPELDGVGFAEQLMERYPDQANVLFFCTGGVLQDDQERFLSGWSNGYLRKPLSASELISCLRSFAAAHVDEEEPAP